MEQAWQAYRDGGFALVDQPSLNLGTVQRPLWLYFELRFSAVLEPGRWFYSLDWPSFERVELYALEGREWRALPRGEVFDPLGERRLQSPRPLFALDAGAAGTQRFLLRLSGDEAMLLSPRVISDRALLAGERQRSFLLGLYFGIILALALYNLMLWLVLRDRSYLWYTLFIGSSALFFVLMNQMLAVWWPELTLRGWSLLVTVSKAMLGLALLLFTRHFMLTQGRDPLSDRLIRLGVWLAPTMPLVNLLGGPHLSLFYSALLGIYCAVVVILAALRALRQGFIPALLVLPAWLILFGSLAVFVTMYMGLLPYTPWTANAFMIGSATEAILLALALGYRIRSLEAERDVLSQRGKQLLALSMSDPLTGLFNKRHLANALKQAVAQAHLQRDPLSLIMLDADHFKAWNDSWGHQAGDEVLHQLGEQIRLHTRDSDVPCRYGGEEFCIILPHTESHAAMQIAERLREAVAALRFEPREGVEAGISISLGVAQLEPDDDMYGLIARSDRALYQAKQQGRDRCVLAG